MFTNQDLKKLIIPLFLEQLLVALVGIADVFVIRICRRGGGFRCVTGQCVQKVDLSFQKTILFF